MSFYRTLLHDTDSDRQALLGTPIIQACLGGQVSLPSYLAFLQEAYHHVRHTVPLLTAMRAALPPQHAWLHGALSEYIAEETGHEEWILDDIAACGADREAARLSQAGLATEAMVACAYDQIARRNPLGFFGMVHVLEGTSVSLALLAADRIQQPLGLPDAAFSYLRSHGTLDLEHTDHFAQLMDQIEAPDDQADIVRAARQFYRLYTEIFRNLPMPVTEPAPAPAQMTAEEVAA
jgi:pyrroloquinoline quinone (PQQ) biosynthesis protein C